MIKFINVYKKYLNKIVLNDISFTLENNSFTLLVGENGSGKSTILKLISKHIQKTSGKIDVDGSVAYLQEKYTLPRHIDVKTYISFLESLYNVDLSYYVKYLDIPKIKIRELSKGNLQKLGIISLVASKAEILLLDEPSEGMDSETKKKFLSILSTFKKEDKTIVISTHDPKDYIKLKTNTIYLREGTICENI
jgi:ABC-2 type transport system ATP-binding protein